MRYIKNFESNIYPKLTYQLAELAWNELWQKYKYSYPKINPEILIRCKYDNDDDIGLFEILIFDDIYKLYISKGTKFLRGIPEDKNKFIKWLEELYLIKK